MAILGIGIGILLLAIVLWDTFETIVLPRTITRRFRLTNLFYLTLWTLWSSAACRIFNRRRDTFLGVFGPLSLILLFVVWAACLVLGFALILWGLGSQIHAYTLHPDFGTDLYMSGTTFFTLGLGDVLPRTPLTRVLTVAEGGMGLGFLAIVIGYLPVLYQSFSRREVGISLLDARAGSPPTGVELLRRHGEVRQMEALLDLLKEWERWAADLLESHLSFPVLAFYRSQHDRESWLSALTAILDACTLLRLGFEGDEAWQARLGWQAQMTFAISRHAAIDLALVLKTKPATRTSDRFSPETFQALCSRLDTIGLRLCRGKSDIAQLTALRQQYEPYLNGLASRLLLPLPPWLPAEEQVDNWQTSAWESAQHFHA